VEVGSPQRAAAKPRSVDYTLYISKLGHELGVLEHGLRITTARAYCLLCIAAHNKHRHSSIGFVAPAERHDGRDIAILAARRATYERARRRHPERWARHTRPWKRPAVVRLNPADGHAVASGGPTGPRNSSPAAARPVSRPRSAEPSRGEGSLDTQGRAKATRDSQGGADRITA